MSTPHVVAIPGSLRDESHTRDALQRTLDAAADAGAETELLDLRTHDLPVYDADHPDAGDAGEFRDRVRAADAVVLGTPVYHGTYASALKAALDYCGSDEFEGTTVGLLAVAGGRFPTPALSHLRETCRVLHADVLSHQVALPRVGDLLADDGRFVDGAPAERVDELGARVVDAARRRAAAAPAGV